MEPLFALVTTDLHLSEKEDDQHRFDLFPWIIDNYRDKLTNVIITGDLTDMKDRHADWFVNAIVYNIKKLGKYFNVYILKGNHDYYNDPMNPFFAFLSDLPNVYYILRPQRLHVKELNGYVLFLPHTRTPVKDWKNLQVLKRDEHPVAIFCHQTFRGAKSETGYELDGISANFFKKYNCPVFSGDVHVPQKIGVVEYIGCPYHVHFGDTFDPRVVLLHSHDGLTPHDVKFPAPKKMTLDITYAGQLKTWDPKIEPGDRVKVRFHLRRSEFPGWPEERDLVKKIVQEELGAKLYSVTLHEDKDGKENEEEVKPRKSAIRSHDQSFRLFCKRQNISGSAHDIGRALMKD